MSLVFKEAVAQWLRVKKERDVLRVEEVQQVTEQTGYCETCYYERITVWITYLDSIGASCSYEWYGDMAELVQELDEVTA